MVIVDKEFEQELGKKIKSVYRENFDSIPYYQDMDYQTDFDINKLVQNRKGTSHHRAPKVAGFIVAVLLVSSSLTVLVTSGSVEAGKDRVLDFFNNLTGNEHMISDNEFSFEISDPGDQSGVEMAEDLIPNLFIENEIFDGYMFDHMTVDKTDKNNIFAHSMYFREDDLQITISQSILDDTWTVNMDGYEEVVEINNGKMYLISNDDNINSIYYMKGDKSFEILAPLSLDSLQEFVEKEIIPTY